MIKDGENEIHLSLKKTNQFLANKNLPIWIAKAGTTTSCRFDTDALHHDLIPNVRTNRQTLGNNYEIVRPLFSCWLKIHLLIFEYYNLIVYGGTHW